MRPPIAILAMAIACATALGCAESAAVPPPRSPVVRGTQRPLELSTVELVRRTMPSVVAVTTPEGTGSGFFVSPNLVATCFHVVRGSKEIRLKAEGWTGAVVSVVAWNEGDDVAILRVSPPAPTRGLKANLGPYTVGSKVVVVSSPLGLRDTVSDGLISALRRDPQDRIQFTAPISPGSSGGPLLNEQGEVVGMVAGFKAGVDDGMTIGQNLNFAVPARLLEIGIAQQREASLESFATETLAPEAKRWQDTGEKITRLNATLPASLGERVGRALASAFDEAVTNRDGTEIKRLLSLLESLQKDRKSLMASIDALNSVGESGSALAREMVIAWEEQALDPSDERKARFVRTMDRSLRFMEEVQRSRRVPDFPEKFAGFPFMASVAVVSEYCFGYRLDAIAGLRTMDCSRMPLPPPFIQGKPSLEFLNGALVAVQANAISYAEAVRALTAKYGEPQPARLAKDGWATIDSASFGLNTSFNWRLNGGRIRVGRLTGPPFVVFIRDERDQAISSSY